MPAKDAGCWNKKRGPQGGPLLISLPVGLADLFIAGKLRIYLRTVNSKFRIFHWDFDRLLVNEFVALSCAIQHG